MLIAGRWLRCEDGVLRPALDGELAAADGSWVSAPLLVDSGADCTVLTAPMAAALGLTPVETVEHLTGVGGASAAAKLPTTLRLYREDGQPVMFRGQFAALADPAALDICVLGRDILNLFAVVVDRPADRVVLVGQRHRYVIEQT
jgi:hypothetical protein